MECTHDLAEKETSCADGCCPICLRAEVTRLQEENKDLKFKLSCHTSTCIADYEELEKEVTRLEERLKECQSEWCVMARAVGNWREFPGQPINETQVEKDWMSAALALVKVKELEEGIERHKKDVLDHNLMGFPHDKELYKLLEKGGGRMT